MGNENTSGGFTGKQIGGIGLCAFGIVGWLLILLTLLVKTGMLNDIAWFTPFGIGNGAGAFIGASICFTQGRRMLCRPSVEATPSKPDDDSGSTE